MNESKEKTTIMGPKIEARPQQHPPTPHYDICSSNIRCVFNLITKVMGKQVANVVEVTSPQKKAPIMVWYTLFIMLRKYMMLLSIHFLY